MIPLVIAAHGTRLPEGVEACHQLVARVRGMLGDAPVSEAYVELAAPPIGEAVASALQTSESVVVVPLMLGRGGHVREDIPEGIAEGRAASGGEVLYGEHLGPDPRLRRAVRQRIAACGWSADETAVVFLGRGCSVPDANADHVRLGRMLFEEGGYADVSAAFIQVAQPSLPTALDRAYAAGERRIVVAPNFLFPGRLQHWAARHVDEWTAAHPDAEVRLAGVIGDCDELAAVVVDRYRQAAARASAESPVYLSGLVLRGRDVVVVGGGNVARRRVPRLLAAGARVHVVAPEVVPELMVLADQGRIALSRREFVDGDLDGAWFVQALTNDPLVNIAVASGAEARHTFCVRADDATGGTAWTPASGTVGGLSVGVVGNRDPRRSAAARDAAVTALSALDA